MIEIVAAARGPCRAAPSVPSCACCSTAVIAAMPGASRFAQAQSSARLRRLARIALPPMRRGAAASRSRSRRRSACPPAPGLSPQKPRNAPSAAPLDRPEAIAVRRRAIAVHADRSARRVSSRVSSGPSVAITSRIAAHRVERLRRSASRQPRRIRRSVSIMPAGRSHRRSSARADRRPSISGMVEIEIRAPDHAEPHHQPPGPRVAGVGPRRDRSARSYWPSPRRGSPPPPRARCPAPNALGDAPADLELVRRPACPGCPPSRSPQMPTSAPSALVLDRPHAMAVGAPAAPSGGRSAACVPRAASPPPKCSIIAGVLMIALNAGLSSSRHGRRIRRQSQSGLDHFAQQPRRMERVIGQHARTARALERHQRLQHHRVALRRAGRDRRLDHRVFARLTWYANTGTWNSRSSPAG